MGLLSKFTSGLYKAARTANDAGLIRPEVLKRWPGGRLTNGWAGKNWSLNKGKLKAKYQIET